MMKKLVVSLLMSAWIGSLFGQTGIISGRVMDGAKPLQFATVKLVGEGIGTISDAQGFFRLDNIYHGSYQLQATFIGYETYERNVDISRQQPSVELRIDLTESSAFLDQVVVTGTRTAKKVTSSPVIVDVINSQTLANTQSVSLSEGLRFQPGLRVETDCQTCNYTQLRMNGLQGGYSQILINSRPIFSPLTGLYGLEQIPTNMIERIEVVRGGGSALYGSGAIGGTVNVITKLPKQSGYDMGYAFQSIDGATEHILSGNATAMNKAGNAGATFFVNKRSREWYDANGDNFSELPSLENNSFGANLFFLPTADQKIDINLSSLNEYRYGGEMVDGPAYLALQSEERTHNVLVGNIDYQINWNEDRSSFISYVAFQNTDRDHYTGILPDDSLLRANHRTVPPYGTSANTTAQAGFQFNHNFQSFPLGSNVFTVGSEFIEDDILDQIPAYRYVIDQTTRNFGAFVQSDWQFSQALSLLSGVRLDHHNLVGKMIASPRFSMLYKWRDTQFRATWGTGFRAPQAFDADLHIAFAGGGISRVQLSPDLAHERSNSISASINHDSATERIIYGFTLEGFYTRLRDAFFLQPLGEDAFGEVFEKQNGDGAVVRGITMELRANYDEKVQLDAGLTIQRSLFETAVENSDVLEPKREFLRTPNEYGYSTLTFTPDEHWNISTNVGYTGSMLVLHFAGAPEQSEDEYFASSVFTEVSFRTSYTFDLPKMDNKMEIFGGIKNLTNAYQDNFDTGKDRDSNFVFGPAAPRTFFVGLRLKSF